MLQRYGWRAAADAGTPVVLALQDPVQAARAENSARCWARLARRGVSVTYTGGALTVSFTAAPRRPEDGPLARWKGALVSMEVGEVRDFSTEGSPWDGLAFVWVRDINRAVSSLRRKGMQFSTDNRSDRVRVTRRA